MNKTEIQNIFSDKFGGQYRLFAAPGRINLIGEHTDYNDGFVMPASIDKKIYLAIHPSATNTVELFAADFSESTSFIIGETNNSLPHWAKYPYGVICELEKMGLNGIRGFKAVFGGNIPEGAGLSSSAALESVFAVALNEIFNLGADKMSLAKVGQAAEHNYAGVRCGIMDQFASIFGKKDHVIRLDCRSLTYEYFPLQLNDCMLVLADTRVKHSLASSAYNNRRKHCEEGAYIIGRHNIGVKSLRDVNLKMIEAAAAILGEEVVMRCTYVVEENQRVLDTCKALGLGNLEEVGRLMKATHHGLRKLYDVSCEELDLLVDTAVSLEGVLGARMMGGGFGGCTLNLIQKDALSQFTEQLETAYYSVYKQKPLFYLVSTDDGAGEITF